MEEAVLEDAQKAVRVALLQRDLKNAQVQIDARFDSVDTDVGRQYDLMKWVIGTLVVGILGMVLTVIVPAWRRGNLS